jgi:intracellular septation protein
MKILVDLFPIILFFIAYKMTGDIITATGVIIAATLVQFAYTWIRHRKIERMHWLTLILILFFGGLTLAFQDATFIKWKPSIANWLFAAVFLFSGMFMQRTLLQRMMDHAVSLPDDAWKRLNLAWVIFFVVMGAVNLGVAYNFSEEIWVDFKLFGMLGMTLVFIIGQGFYIARFAEESTPSADD